MCDLRFDHIPCAQQTLALYWSALLFIWLLIHLAIYFDQWTNFAVVQEIAAQMRIILSGPVIFVFIFHALPIFAHCYVLSYDKFFLPPSRHVTSRALYVSHHVFCSRHISYFCKSLIRLRSRSAAPDLPTYFTFTAIPIYHAYSLYSPVATILLVLDTYSIYPTCVRTWQPGIRWLVTPTTDLCRPHWTLSRSS